MRFSAFGLGGLAIAAASFAIPSTAHAALLLTPAGVAAGFTLTTFATINTGFVSIGFGPFGLAVSTTGVGQPVVIVSNFADSTRYSFPNVDGQTIATATNAVPSNSSTEGYASALGVPYGTDDGRYVQFNNDGTINRFLTGVSATPFLGLAGAPNGHLVAASNSGLIDIDPTAAGGTGSFRVINGNVFPDGVTVSNDGTIAYVADGDLIQAYSIANGALLNSFNTSGRPDGVGLISGTAFDGFIVANTNNGNVDLIDPSNNTFAVIASGGTRGDYTAPDPTNGTLLLDFSDIIARLGIAGGTIGGGGGNPGPVPAPTLVPEPTTLALLGFGLAGLGFARRKGC